MTEETFLSALQGITAGALTLGDVITAAGHCTEAGKPKLAEQLYKVWIRFNPDDPLIYVAQFNMSGLLTQAGDLEGSRAALSAAIAASPDFAPAYINLGGILERLGDADGAVEQWMAVVNKVGPINGAAVNYSIGALKQLGRVFGENLRHAAAETVLRQCLDLNTSQRDVMEQFFSLRLAQCKWPIVAPWEGVDRETFMRGVHPLSMAAYADDPLLQLAAAARYAERSVTDKPRDGYVDRRHAPIDLSGRRLRIGYVSSDLRDHAVGYLMSELFEVHDRSKVEVFAYYCGIPTSDALNARTRAALEHYVDIRDLNDDAAAAQIAADGIDILVDVNGHTRDARPGVFARRPAPIQVNWLGYPGTMGSPLHHYIIADDWIIPPESEIYYSEKVLRLPCYQPNDRKRAVAERPSRAAAGLPEDAVVFCCFNGVHKITRFTYERWMEILQRVPGSVLWLLDSVPETVARLREVAEQHGIDASRLIIAPKLINSQHLARYPLADLFLDTTPYGAHTTASDAMWMGVPVLTLTGRSFAARVCGSLVRAAGLPELVADTPEAFVEQAVALGQDRAAIAALKARLEANRATCDLFNMDKLAARLEDLYQEMAADYQRGALPRPDLQNLDDYFAVGITLDQEAQEILTHPDYHGLYKAMLAKRHLTRQVAPDRRLWTAADISDAEADAFASEPAAARTKRRTASA
jgi:predicted O-linked N-acetylglucosamine transferase (SPINDLY family)